MRKLLLATAAILCMASVAPAFAAGGGGGGGGGTDNPMPSAHSSASAND